MIFKYFSSIKKFLIKNTYIKSVFPQNKFLDSYNYRSQISRPKVHNIFRYLTQIWQKIWKKNPKTKQKEPSSYWNLLTYEGLNGPAPRTSLPRVGSEEVGAVSEVWDETWQRQVTGQGGKCEAGLSRPPWTLHQETTRPPRASQLLGQLAAGASNLRNLNQNSWFQP